MDVGGYRHNYNNFYKKFTYQMSINYERTDGYYVAYKPITLSSIFFMFVEMKFIHCHSCVMFAMKSMSRCND